MECSPVCRRRGESKAGGRREGLTSYLRTLLADPVINKCDELVSFLEISSASELFAKLHEKDTQFMLNLAAKDEETEKMRINLQAASAERSTARAALVARQEDLDESKDAWRRSPAGCSRARTRAAVPRAAWPRRSDRYRRRRRRRKRRRLARQS